MHLSHAAVSRAAMWRGPEPSTLLHVNHVLTKRKYRMLFSCQRGRRRGPKGPTKELVDAVIEVKRRNPSWG
jgi:putative transposase